MGDKILHVFVDWLVVLLVKYRTLRKSLNKNVELINFKIFQMATTVDLPEQMQTNFISIMSWVFLKITKLSVK